MLSALGSGAEYVGFWDADLATPLEDIESFCRVLDGKPRIETVVGTRIRLLGHRIERQPTRYWLGRLFANTASVALGLRVFDTQCGAKLFRVTPTTAKLFERPFLTRWIFDVEILARMRQLAARHELAVIARDDLRIPARRLARRGRIDAPLRRFHEGHARDSQDLLDLSAARRPRSARLAADPWRRDYRRGPPAEASGSAASRIMSARASRSVSGRQRDGRVLQQPAFGQAGVDRQVHNDRPAAFGVGLARASAAGRRPIGGPARSRLPIG